VEKVGCVYTEFLTIGKKERDMGKPIVQVVCAISKPQGIFGEGNSLPWEFGRPNEDFKRFVTCTQGSVIMGRATWESLPLSQRPLKNRRNIVVTRNPVFQAEGAKVCSSLESALQEVSTGVVSIIGGRELIKEAFEKKLVTVAHVTVVSITLACSEQTVYFPELLDYAFFEPLTFTSSELHDQVLKDGGTVQLKFYRYELAA
jgi:dihydrofolate reductase